MFPAVSNIFFLEICSSLGLLGVQLLVMVGDNLEIAWNWAKTCHGPKTMKRERYSQRCARACLV
jgi:hypothetical protein